MVETKAPRPIRRLVGPRVAVPLAMWSFAYAGYRAYYAAGGQFGMIGRPVSDAQFRALNAVGAAIILLGAVLPLVAVRVTSLRQALPVIGWIAAVGRWMHALVDGTLRVLSVTGVHPTQLPTSAWRSVDRHAADLQDLPLNEPWFFVEGLLWAALGIGFVHTSGHRVWTLSAIAACVLLTAVGALSGLGTIGSFHLG